MQWAGIRTIAVSPEDPEANGLVENFMKAMNKIWHIAHIEGKNHKQELYKFLRHYRATPHSSTSRAPAEVLFNRKFQVRLPQKQEPAHDTLIRQRKTKEMQRCEDQHKTTQHQDRRPGAVDYFRNKQSPIQDTCTTQIPTKSLPSREPKLQQQEDLLKYENKTSNDSRSSRIQYVLSKCTIPTESTQR